MNEIALDKRRNALNNQLSEVLHHYLLACDALHKDRGADIGHNLSSIQSATIDSYRIMIDYTVEYGRGT